MVKEGILKQIGITGKGTYYKLMETKTPQRIQTGHKRVIYFSHNFAQVFAQFRFYFTIREFVIRGNSEKIMINKTKVDDFLYEKESYIIRGACFEVWKEFGGAFKESIVDKALSKALKSKGLQIEDQKRIDIYFKLSAFFSVIISVYSAEFTK